MAFFRIFYKQVSATPHGAVEGDLKCVDVQDYDRIKVQVTERKAEDGETEEKKWQKKQSR